MTEKKIMDAEMEKNGVNDNCLEETTCDNVTNNNQPAVVVSHTEDKHTGKAKVTTQYTKKMGKTYAERTTARSNGTSVVITVQPPATMEKPPRRQRRTSDVIDSMGMDLPSPEPGSVTSWNFNSRRVSTDGVVFPLTPSSSDRSSSSSVPSTPTKPPELRQRRLADTIDAAPMSLTNAGEEEPMSMPTSEAAMPTEKYADEYNMNYPRRGRAIVFNNDEFEMPGMKQREGSDVDVKNLQSLYSALGFEITIHHNKEYSEIRKIVTDLSEEDHSDADCLVLTVLSHGMGSGYLLARDVPYQVEQLWTPFTADRCATLAGKPKIFFIQACRGEKLDPGVNLVKRRSRTETDSSGEYYKIPTHADFLLAYSSVEGFFSFRNPESGTWFIQCLCEELLENSQSHDLLKLLTRTARRVALDHESYNDIIPWHHQQKQVPTITSMLIRDVYFRPKK